MIDVASLPVPLPVIALAVTVAAPAIGAVVLRFTERLLDPRMVAAGAIVTSLAASVVAAAWWHLGDATPARCGPRLVGGDLVLVDGLTASAAEIVAAVPGSRVVEVPGGDHGLARVSLDPAFEVVRDFLTGLRE